MYIFRQTS